MCTFESTTCEVKLHQEQTEDCVSAVSLPDALSAASQLSQKHKVGVLLCRAGQSTEEEMYNNEEASAAFAAFLELLGEQVLLKGFAKYAAQLDTKSESEQEPL